MESVTRVVRIKRHKGEVVQGCDVYIGRACNMGGWRLPASEFANPFKAGKDGTLEECVIKYRNHILSRPDLIAKLIHLKGKILGCWCKPKRCHGDILVELIEQFYPTKI